MIRLAKFLRLLNLNIKQSKKSSTSLNMFNINNSSKYVINKSPSSELHSNSVSRVPPYHSNSAFSTDANKLDSTYEKACEETLESLTEFFEELVESEKRMEMADVSYSSGVLNVNLGQYGTYVINRQSPNKQIWLSSPISGPKRYDYIPEDCCWIYKHDAKTLHQLLEDEISQILGRRIDMSKCSHFK